MQLNPPPLISHLLFEQPLPMIIALFTAAIILFLIVRRRIDRRLTLLAFVLLALAALIFVLSITITTDREQLHRSAQQLVNQTAPMNTSALRTMFTAVATLQGPKGNTWLNHDQLFTELDRINQRHDIQSHSLRELQTEVRSVTRGKLQSTRGLTLINLRTALNTPLGNYNVNTLWLVTWKRTDTQQWQVASIQWLELQNKPPGFGAWR